MDQAIDRARTYVRNDMSMNNDPSHDNSHIQRVTSLAQQIANAEEAASTKLGNHSPFSRPLNNNIITLAALLHDVGDKKYLKKGLRGHRMVYDFLTRKDNATTISADFAEVIQTIVSHVSYSKEMRLRKKSPGEMGRLIQKYPELAVVQDADRLDALGAIGVGRAFAFAGAKATRDGSSHRKHRRFSSCANNGLLDSVQHMGEKLEHLQDLMKTSTGKAMAVERTTRIKQVKQWFFEELEEATQPDHDTTAGLDDDKARGEKLHDFDNFKSFNSAPDAKMRKTRKRPTSDISEQSQSKKLKRSSKIKREHG